MAHRGHLVVNRRKWALAVGGVSATTPASLRRQCVVAAYKQRLSHQVLDQAEAFQPMWLTLLSLILDVDNNLKFVKDAVAAWR